VLEIKSLTKRFTNAEAPAIDSVDFDVKDGEVVGFVGLNGAGKTTTIRIATGISLPTVGTVMVDGHDIVEDKVEASKLIGWVPEIPNFEPGARALDLMKYFSGYYGVEGSEADSTCLQLLEEVGLKGAEMKRIREYSQGMKKRFALASSLLSKPNNFLFDEILNGLDPEGIQYFRNLIADLRKAGKAVLLSSHILAEVGNLSDRVVFIHHGKVIKIAPRSEFAALSSGMIRIRLENPDDAAEKYLSSLGNLKNEGEDLVLSRFTGAASALNSELVARGYRVSSFSVQMEGLEDYFFKLIGGTK
jgi:ABC-2 type transport system ATP-binding protein